MSKKLKSLFMISFVFILVGVTISLNSNGLFKRTLLTSVNEQINNDTYGKIHFISVTKHPYSGSDAILIESQGHLCLVDSGNPDTWGDYNYTNGENGKKVVSYIKSIGGTHLDCIIATHNHSDHIGGMPDIASSGLVDSNTKYYYRTYTRTKEDTDNPSWDNEGYYTRAINAMNSKSAQLIDVTNNDGYEITVGNFKINLINTETWAARGNSGTTPRENYNSIVEVVQIGTTKALLAADMESNDESRLMRDGKIGPVDILKMGHHGAATSTSHDFIDVTDPATVIVTGTPELSLTERNVGALKQLKEMGRNTDIYYTSEVDDAIVVKFKNDNTYTVVQSDGSSAAIAKPKLSFPTTSSPWTKAVLNTGTAWYIFDDKNQGVYDGWQQLNNKWYYFTKFTGYMYTGWVNDGGHWYYLSEESGSEGQMLTGWVKASDDYYYYLSESEGWVNPYDHKSYKLGEMVTGWYESQPDEWYYLLPSKVGDHPTGSMASNLCMNIDNKRYCFDKNGTYSIVNSSIAEIPTDSYCKSGLVYNGSNQTLTKAAGTGYTFSGNVARDAGKYLVSASLKDNYVWRNNSSGDKTFYCTISKATPNVSGVPTSINVNKGATTKIDLKSNVAGRFIVNSSSGNSVATPNELVVTANTAKSLTIAGVGVGTNTITIKFRPTDTTNYEEVTKSINVIVNESGNTDYTLTVSPNGGTWRNSKNNTTFNLTAGATMTIENPTRDGYTFKNWSLSNTSTKLNGTTLTMGSQNTTVTANWERNSYTIKFNANGGSGSMQDVSVYYNVTHTLPTNKFIRTNFTFKGWATSANGGVVYRDGATVGNLASGNTNVVNLYAVWDPKEFTIQYDSNGGTTGTMQDSTSTNGKIKLTNCAYARENYVFAGWSLEADGGVIYQDGETITNPGTNEVVKLYAQWIAEGTTEQYTIQYKANGGTGEDMPNFVGYENTKVKLRKNTYTKADYKFIGWSTEQDGSVEYVDEEEVILTSSLTLYACWQREENLWNTVIYDANGGTGEMGNTLFYSGTDVKLSPNKFTKENATFMGWSLDSNGDVVYSDGEVIEIEGNEVTVKLYAVWKDNPKDSDSNEDTILSNFPDTAKFSGKINIALALILLLSGSFVLIKATKKETK